MNYLLTFFLLIFSCSLSYAQKEKGLKVYFLNGTLDYVKEIDRNGYILTITKINERKFEFAYYLVQTTKLVVFETYSDENRDSANGIFAYYNYNGNIDSMCKVINFKREGDWLFYDSYGKKKDSILYCKKYKNGKLQDSSTTRKEKSDSGYIEAKFANSWRKYLEGNLKYPTEAQNGKFKGDVNTLFAVNVDGTIDDLIILQSANIYLDIEAKRVIKKSSGFWKAAILNGIPVKKYHAQIIKFVLAE